MTLDVQRSGNVKAMGKVAHITLTGLTLLDVTLDLDPYPLIAQTITCW